MSLQLASQLKSELFSRYSLVPSEQWLNEFLSNSRNPSHPLPALTSTAHFRLLSTDFTTTLSTRQGKVLPAKVSDVHTKELILQIDIPVQVLDIQDTSTSKWSQIEAIERVERGEEIRGREVIRNVPGINDDDDADGGDQGQVTGSSSRPSATSSTNASGNSKKGSTGPHKVLLQDAAGTKAWAFETSRIERITIVNSNPPVPGATATQTVVEGMQIGCKFVLRRGTKVRRGLIMMTPANTTVMGGKVEAWDKKWREGRKARLHQELERENSG
ncbi:hypothetical protein PMZ80_005076 [Knufia obscura]|nr:hypothetical protein PMZ80_005076 [Knufia obscura]